MGGPAPLVMGTSPAPRVATAPPAQIVVQPGETVYGLARTYGVSPSAIIAANHLRSPNRILIGSVLVIPREGGRAAPVEIAALPPQPSAAASVEPQAAPVRATAPTRVTALPVERPPPPPSPVAAVPAEPPSPSSPPRQASPAELSPPPPAHRATKSPEAAKPSPAAETGKTHRPSKEPPSRATPLTATRDARFLWPVHGHVIAGFGTGPKGAHNEGINIAAPRGAPVEATAPGVVAYAGNELQGYGNLILIRHKDRWISAYAHLDVILVKRGQKVSRGTVIGRVGATGSVRAPQLHFELRRADRAVDPLKFLPPHSTAAASPQQRRG